ncbi:MAG: disulfide bond formation protein B [Nitriliruptoraceae bacterium]|nr:disulfide bond formation protein B [Nitriliruptoraceae bacterium]
MSLPFVIATERTFGVLALVAVVIAVGTTVALVRRSVPSWLETMALPTALAIATVTAGGSLLVSIGFGYVPCELCWYQRIAAYPLVPILAVAWWRGDRDVWRTVLPLSVIGSALSLWHLVIERNPGLGGPCDPSAPCAVRWVEEFGVLTLPAMALITFVAVTVLSLAARGRAD